MSESSSQNPTSPTLLEKAKRNEPDAWERMARMYGPMVYSWAREAGLQPEDAADVVQDVFRSLVAAIHSFDGNRPGGRFRNWLHGVTRNRLLDYFRRVSAEPVGVGGSTANLRLQEFAQQSFGSSSNQTGAHALAMRALRLIEKDFEPQTWQAFWKVTVDGHGPQHVATELGMSIAAVYKARSRVLQRLRSEMLEPPQ